MKILNVEVSFERAVHHLFNYWIKQRDRKFMMLKTWGVMGESAGLFFFCHISLAFLSIL